MSASARPQAKGKLLNESTTYRWVGGERGVHVQCVCQSPSRPPQWLDSWVGIGHMAVGMARQGYDLQITHYEERG
jgi:hypothetical protein